jgi:hypothetical protein
MQEHVTDKMIPMAREKKRGRGRRIKLQNLL